MENSNLLILKTKLQGFGALRPEAWEMIVQLCQQTQLKTNESFIREPGALAYVTNGLLKEYDSQHRKNPSIINFIGSNQSLITRKHNQNHYLSAFIPTLVLHWNYDSLALLYEEFPELKTLYDHLVASYDSQTAFKMLLLEQPTIIQKIQIFVKQHSDILPLLKKRDIARYMNVDYEYFIRHYSKLL